MHAQQAITAIKKKDLTEACKKLVETKKEWGHGLGSHDHSVV
jgi:hypothetical protein